MRLIRNRPAQTLKDTNQPQLQSRQSAKGAIAPAQAAVSAQQPITPLVILTTAPVRNAG
jgi:hypothetical protein